MPADFTWKSGELRRYHSFLRKTGGGRSLGCTASPWEELSPELFALILKAVQRNAEREAGEARRVVALAGVCRRWRHLIQQMYSSPLADLGLLQFPFALRQPGPSQRPIHCLLKRKGSSYVLFQQNFGDGGDEKLDFLMAAQRKWKACGSCFSISASHTSFSKAGHAYMGKLRSDFWGADFKLWEVSGNDQSKNKRLALQISFSDSLLQERLRHRSMVCELFAAQPKVRYTSSALSPATSASCTQTSISSSTAAIQVVRMTPSHNLLGCFGAASPLLDVRPQKPARTFLRSYSSLRRANYGLERSNSRGGAQLARMVSSRLHSRELGLMRANEKSIIMENKAPHWDERRQCWSLDFHGRASLPSLYSFQLVQPLERSNVNSGAAQDAENSIAFQEDNEVIYLQLGKIGKGFYTMDFCHPLSAFQAFSICLSSFASKVGMEP